MWLRSVRAKIYLADTIREINIYGAKMTVYDTYPSSKTVPNEKKLYKDRPMDVSDNRILKKSTRNAREVRYINITSSGQ